MGIAHENTSTYDRLSYDGLPRKEKYHEDPPREGLCPSYRLLVALTCMMNLVMAFASQTTMSSAMVCMIRNDNYNMTNDMGRQLSLEYNETDYTTLNYTNGLRAADDLGAWRFDWTSETQGWILFSFYICYVIAQMPSGIAVSRFGPTRLIVVSHVLSSLGHFLTVPATQVGLPLLYIARIISGISTGFLYTSSFQLIAKWAPRRESSTLYGISGVGIEGGNIFAFGMGMFACELSVQGGWPFIFYGMGGVQFLLALFMLWRVSDSPLENRYVKPSEALYIQRNVAGSGYDEDSPKTSRKKTPVRRILTSKPVYAIAVSQSGTLLMYYTLITQGPIYLRDIIDLSNLQINTVLCVPFILVIPLVYVLGWFCDWLVGRGTLTTTALRKIMDCICKFSGVLTMVCLGFVPRHDVTSVFLCYFLMGVCISLSYVSYVPNAGDLSPDHAGFIASIQQTGSLWVSFVVPPVVGPIVQEKTRERWLFVFFVEIIYQVLTLLFYLKFGSGELQPWAVDDPSLDKIVTSKAVEYPTPFRKLSSSSNGGLPEDKLLFVHSTGTNTKRGNDEFWNGAMDYKETTALLADRTSKPRY